MQETETLTLPVSNKAVVLRGYITGGIDSEVQRIRAGANKMHYEMEIDPSTPTNPDGTPVMPKNNKAVMDIDPTINIEADNKLLELMLVSVDGQTTDLLNLVMLLPKQDVNFIKSKLDDMQAASQVGDGEKKD
jgi:hypothetical protein